MTKRKPRTLGAQVPDELYEHYEILAARMTEAAGKTVSVSALVKAALQDLATKNPVDPTERQTWRARRDEAKASPTVTVGPGGQLVALAERPDIVRTYETLQAMKGASLAADGRVRGGVRRREGDSNTVSVVRAHRAGPTVRPAMRVRPDATPRHLRAV